MPTARVLCLGEVLWDCLADRSGLPLEAVEAWTAYPGGAPANVACALPKMGVQSGFLGCVGRDPAGDRLVEILQTSGVNIAGIQRHPTAPTREVYVLRDDKGDRRFAAFGAEGKGEQNTTAFADAHLQADGLPVGLFADGEILVLGTLELAYAASREAVERALDWADRYYLKIVLDANWRPIFWPDPDRAPEVIYPLLERVDFLKLAREEAEWLLGTDDPSAIAAKIDQLEGVIVTDGDRGCRYWLSEQTGAFPAFPVAATDTTGAGDAFVAGFVRHLCETGMAALADPDEAQAAIVYASAAGALTALKPGAISAQPNHAQIVRFLQQNGYSL